MRTLLLAVRRSSRTRGPSSGFRQRPAHAESLLLSPEHVALARSRRLPEAPTLSTRSMRHALMYVGGFERNFPKLTTSSTSFEGTDGQTHPYAPWPASADGLRVSSVSYTHLRAHETPEHLVCRLL